MLIRFLYAFLVFLSLQASTLGQALRFDVFMNDNKIGGLKVTKTLQNGMINYQLESNTLVTFIKTLEIQTSVSCVYLKGRLIKSKFYNFINKNQTVNSVLNWQDGKYNALRNDKKIVFAASFVNYSTTNLYVEEPVSVSRVFSENLITFLELNKHETHAYTLILPDGQKNVYEYHSGKLSKAILSYKLYEIVIKAAIDQ